MGRLMLSYINRADAATLSGGSWTTDLPLANLKQQRLSKLARSSSAATSSTKFDIDLGATPVTVRLVGLMRHNLTQDATYRITGGASPGATTVDTGWSAAWPAIYGLFDREFEHPEWFSGRLSTAEAAAYPIKLLVDLGQHHVYRYWRLEISDTGNAAGAVLLGRLWMGPIWQPTINYDWGAAFLWQSRDRATEARSGARFVEALSGRRAYRFTLHELSDQEAFGRIAEQMRQIGTEGEMLVIPDPDDAGNAHRRNILGRVASWGDGIVDAAYGKQMISMTIEERL